MKKTKGVIVTIILSLMCSGGMVAYGAGENPSVEKSSPSYNRTTNDYEDPSIIKYDSGEIDATDGGEGETDGVDNIRKATGEEKDVLEGKGNTLLKSSFDSQKNSRKPGDENLTGTKSIFLFILTIAKEIKNIIFAVASIFLIVLVFRLLLAENSEEEYKTFKKGIIWTVFGIILMQMAFSITTSLIGTSVTAGKATSFVANIIKPVIDLVLFTVPFMFLGVAIYSFFKIVTANGDDSKVTAGKQSIIHAAIAIIVIKISTAFVNGIYGMVDCGSGGNVVKSTNCLKNPNASGIADIFFDLINWANSFLAIIITIIFIYTGFSLITASGNKDKMEKARRLLVYVVVGVILIAGSYTVLTFFTGNKF